MADKKQEIADLLVDLKKFERSAKRYRLTNAQERTTAVGTLSPEMLYPYRDASALPEQGLVLLYGQNMQMPMYFTPERLHQFIKEREKLRGKFKTEDNQGVTIEKLLMSSRKVDHAKAKDVRSALLYQRKGNLLYFQVSGNSKPFYRVIIRLEQWAMSVLDVAQKRKSSPVAVRDLLKGRVSIECPCGRHQFWYRYLATMGNFAIDPVEHDYPKIRNPHLTGCCCKHVIRTLKELQKNKTILVLARQLETEANKRAGSGKTGYGSIQPNGVADQLAKLDINKGGAYNRMLGIADLEILRSKRISKGAFAAIEKDKAKEKELMSKQKPRKAVKKAIKIKPDKAGKKITAIKLTPEQVAGIKNAIKGLRAAGLSDKDIKSTTVPILAKNTGITAEEVWAIANEGAK